mgnify:CR=1 FL=1
MIKSTLNFGNVTEETLWQLRIRFVGCDVTDKTKISLTGGNF